jgi:hypothetical protein
MWVFDHKEVDGRISSINPIRLPCAWITTNGSLISLFTFWENGANWFLIVSWFFGYNEDN